MTIEDAQGPQVTRLRIEHCVNKHVHISFFGHDQDHAEIKLAELVMEPDESYQFVRNVEKITDDAMGVQ